MPQVFSRDQNNRASFLSGQCNKTSLIQTTKNALRRERFLHVLLNQINDESNLDVH